MLGSGRLDYPTRPASRALHIHPPIVFIRLRVLRNILRAQHARVRAAAQRKERHVERKQREGPEQVVRVRVDMAHYGEAVVDHHQVTGHAQEDVKNLEYAVSENEQEQNGEQNKKMSRNSYRVTLQYS